MILNYRQGCVQLLMHQYTLKRTVWCMDSKWWSFTKFFNWPSNSNISKMCKQMLWVEEERTLEPELYNLKGPRETEKNRFCRISTHNASEWVRSWIAAEICRSFIYLFEFNWVEWKLFSTHNVGVGVCFFWHVLKSAGL